MKLKKFNEKKEHKKIMFIKNKTYNIKLSTIILSVLILTIAVMLFTYSAFSVSTKMNVMHAKVGNFIQDDYTVLAYVDGKPTGVIPSKSFKYSVSSIECNNNATGTWDYDNWGILITGTTTSNTVCSVYFASFPDPELYQGMVPVELNLITNGIEIMVADTSEEWYNYDDHRWANAVLVSNPSDYLNNDGTVKSNKIGTKITSGILQYYVWIPRYKYKLWNAEVEAKDEQMIEVAFETKNVSRSNGTQNDEWLTHPAFKFGNTELNGFWVGKFEMTGSIPTSSSNATNLTILPTSPALTNKSIKQLHDALRNQDIQYASNYGLDSSEIDIHMIKNIEWGAVAYLYHSKFGRFYSDGTCTSGGCEIWSNPTYRSSDSALITGCASSYVSSANDTYCAEWYTTYGLHSSTTDNQYGIYGMHGGAGEYVMLNTSKSNDSFVYSTSSSGLTTKPNDRYIDTYTIPATTDVYMSWGKLGDATREVVKDNQTNSSDRYTYWYKDNRGWGMNERYSWMFRGGWYERDNGIGGIFFMNLTDGASSSYTGTRAVLSAQDGNNNDIGY